MPLIARTVSSRCSRISADSFDESGEATLDDLLLAQPLRDARGVGLGAAGQVLERGQDAAQLLEPRVLRPEAARERVEAIGQDLRVGVGGDRQARPRVAQVEGAVRELELELLGLERAPVLIRQDRQEHSIAQLGLDRRPVDVEEAGAGGGPAVLEHVQPPGVGVARDAHVVRDHVEDQAEAARGQRGGQAIEGGRPADLGIERIVIGDVVAVRAAGPAAEARGEVRVAHPEGVEIGAERGHRVEAERAPQLQAIGGVTLAAQRGRRLLEEDADIDHALEVG